MSVYMYRVAQKERMILKWVVVGRVFLWGYLKSKIDVRKPRTVDDLKVSIREEIATVPQEMLVNVMQNFEERLRTFVRQEGRHSIRNVLRPTTSTQVFLGFPVPKSKC